MLAALLLVPVTEAYAEPLFYISDTTPAENIVNEGLKGAAYDDMVEFGTFTEGTPQELRNYLTEVRQFKEYSAEDGYTTQTGDIIFRLDHNTAVSAFVTDGGKAFLYKKAAVVHVIYPRYETIVYQYLTKDMNLSLVTACGIMANIYCESMFDPEALEETNQHGYGLMQWTGDRQDDFLNWCTENGCRRNSIFTQLRYFDYEMKSEEFAPLLRSMRGCTQDGDGAYDVAHIFCLNFEIPDRSEELAEERGALAQEGFYKAYINAS